MGPLRGTLRVPGDKSISHRALIFGAIAEGETRITGLADGADVRSSRACIEALGARVEDAADGTVVVHGRGLAGLAQDADAEPIELDCGNSGTSARLLLGLLAGVPGRFVLHGDDSLSQRPMDRVLRPLREMGARFKGEGQLPIEVVGGPLRGAEVETEVASAQVKSALLLAGLSAQGQTVVRVPRPSRDHTERMLAAMGAAIERPGGSPLALSIEGGTSLRALEVTVPGDPSSAAFAAAIAATKPGSALEVRDLGLNPTRTGFYRFLARMNAPLELQVEREVPEPVGTLTVLGGRLSGIEVAPDEVVDAIDELPLLACVAALADGPSRVTGASELRYKESDRIKATHSLLRNFGIPMQPLRDGFVLEGGAHPSPRGPIEPYGDHRIAMCAAVLAAHCLRPGVLENSWCVDVSYPSFFEDLEELGA